MVRPGAAAPASTCIGGALSTARAPCRLLRSRQRRKSAQGAPGPQRVAHRAATWLPAACRKAAGAPIHLVHLVKLVNEAYAAVRKNERTALKRPLARHRVFVHRRGEPDCARSLYRTFMGQSTAGLLLLGGQAVCRAVPLVQPRFPLCRPPAATDTFGTERVTHRPRLHRGSQEAPK